MSHICHLRLRLLRIVIPAVLGILILAMVKYHKSLLKWRYDWTSSISVYHPTFDHGTNKNHSFGMEFANVARGHHSQGRSGDRRTSWMRHLQYIVVMQDSWCRLNFLWQMRSSAKHIIFAKVCTILRQDNLVDGRGHVVGRHGRIIVYRILNQDTATSALSSTLQWDLAGIFRTTSIFSRYREREEREESKQDMKRTGSTYFIIFHHISRFTCCC